MAAKKKKVKKKATKRTPRSDDAACYAEFIGDLLSGTVKAVQLYDTRNGQGKLELEYDEEVDDNGVQGGGQSRVLSSDEPTSEAVSFSAPTARKAPAKKLTRSKRSP
jgi:hypothetical protein